MKEVRRVRRYLVVANQTLGGEHLMSKVRECMAAGPSRFHIVVPASQPPEHMTHTEGQARALAGRRLEVALERFRAIGADVQGEVGDGNPVEAISDTMRLHAFDEVILSTLPPGVSRWIHQDLPHRVERLFDLPVIHVIADKEAAAAS